MVVVVQLVRAPDCGSGGRGFESHHPPQALVYGQGLLFPRWDIAKSVRQRTLTPSFRWFESSYPNQKKASTLSVLFSTKSTLAGG